VSAVFKLGPFTEDEGSTFITANYLFLGRKVVLRNNNVSEINFIKVYYMSVIKYHNKDPL
jgi:hypothetical protein